MTQALFLIPCSGYKNQYGNLQPWNVVRQKSEHNYFRDVLDPYRECLVNFSANLPREKADEVYVGGDAERPRNAWLRNRQLLSCRTVCAMKRYRGSLYQQIDDEVVEGIMLGRFSNLLIVSALFGMIKPTDKIPDYDLMMKDMAPNGTYIYNYWKSAFEDEEFIKCFENIAKDYEHIFFLMHSYGGYKESVQGLLGKYDSYYCAGKANLYVEPEKLGRILNIALKDNLCKLGDLRKISGSHQVQIIKFE